MKPTAAPALPDTPAELLRAVRDQKRAADRRDVEMMRLAVHWADLHLADPDFAEACFTSPKTFAGEGSPAIDEFCVPEFATMLGRTNDSAGRFLTDCVELAYRLPQLWAAVQQGLVAGWRARLIAESTLALSLDAAAYVDSQVFWCASRLTPSQLDRLVEEARVRHMPAEVEESLQRSADKRHVTFDTQQCSFDGTMHVEANLEIPDALALARRWRRVRSTWPSWGRPTPSTAAGPPRWGTWPDTSSPSASTTPRTTPPVEEGRRFRDRTSNPSQPADGR